MVAFTVAIAAELVMILSTFVRMGLKSLSGPGMP